MQSIDIPLDDILMSDPPDGLLAQFSQLYGNDESLLRERAGAWRKLVEAFGQSYGYQTGMFVVRAPGRVNLLGKHSDTQGGYSCTFPISNEILLTARARNDQKVVLNDVRSDLFGPREFCIDEFLSPDGMSKLWEEYVHLIYPRLTPGDWVNYIMGPFVLLQKTFPDRKIRGIEAVLCGNIVQAAGLSSSSAISVTATMAAYQANGLQTSAEELVSLSGQAELFAGSRGGAGDQAAIILPPPGKILHSRTVPKPKYELLDIPSDCEVLAIYSGIPAVKTVGRAKDLYNQHTASYKLAVKLLQKASLTLSKVNLIADLLEPKLGFSEKDALKAVLLLPQRISRKQLLKKLPYQDDWLETIFSSHAEPPEGYPLRKICLFGLGEFTRSKIAAQLLKSGDIIEFGRLMFISHDGDRQVTHNQDGTAAPYSNEALDDCVDDLIRRAADSPGVYRVLPYVPGGYGNSCPELDLIVDICKAQPGVLGACLTGAGFGGHVLALLEKDRSRELIPALNREYYDRKHLECLAYLCHPVRGATLHQVL